MLKTLSRALFVMGMIIAAVAFSSAPALAGDTLLSNNRGTESAIFYIEGEPSAVINGFDLTPLGVQLPVALDAVRISVAKPLPGINSELLVYVDSNGGSPIDARLVHRQQVALQGGLNRVQLTQAAIIDEPVVWVGFNMPVGLEFHADVSGSSLLTYWAWTPGGSFDVNSLANAAVLGPGDGSAPVNIAMDGIARITAELDSMASADSGTIPVGQQIQSRVAQDTSIMRDYPECGGLLYDPEDIEISAQGAYSLRCHTGEPFNAPAQVARPMRGETRLVRLGNLYKLDAGGMNLLPVPVTHCIRVPEGHLSSAVIGEGRYPQGEDHTLAQWYILPSVRFNDLVCAEITVPNYLAYFVPETTETPSNVNLVAGWTVVDPHPLVCGYSSSIRAQAVNTGQEWFNTPDNRLTITVRDVHVASGIETARREFHMDPGQFGPGARRFIDMGPLRVDAYLHELHRVEVIVDSDNEVAETD